MYPSLRICRLSLVIGLLSGIGHADSIAYFNGAPNQADGCDISGFVCADDFTIGESYTLTSIQFFSSANFDPYPSQFSGMAGWSIFADASGTPGTLLVSGTDDNPGLSDTGVQILGTEEWQVSVALPSVVLGTGTYWLGLRNGAWGSPDDGNTIYWDTTGSQTGSVGMFTADLTGGSGWTPNGLVSGNGSDLAFTLFGNAGGTTTSPVPEPSSLLPLGIGLLILLVLRHRVAQTFVKSCRNRFTINAAPISFFAIILLCPQFADAQLTHSDYPNLFYGDDSDSETINVVIVNSPTVPFAPAGSHTVYINGGQQGVVQVLSNGTLQGHDPGLPYQQTVSIGGLGTMDGVFQQYDGSFSYTVQVDTTTIATLDFTNHFVWDYYSGFDIYKQVYTPHDPQVYTTTYYYYLNPIKPRDPHQQGSNKPSPKPSPCPCADYAFNSGPASLEITDTPISYSPPRGPTFRVQLSYNETDSNPLLPATYSTFGPNWSFNWMTYVLQGPASTRDTTASLYVAGGSQELFTNFMPSTTATNGSSLRSAPNELTRAAMQEYIGAGYTVPNLYRLENPDGSLVEYDYRPTQGSSIVFLTSTTDPQGQVYTVNYAPGTAQILSITDPLGQNTMFSYGLSSFPFNVTQITDPFGRSASFTYDTQGRLMSITDPVGIVSSFSYQGAGAFIQSMTTPYGTTTFSTGSTLR